MSNGRQAARVDWDKVFEILYGHPVDKPEPRHLKVMQDLAKKVGNAFLGHGKEIIRQVTSEASKQDLLPYLQYVFFILMERSREWPSLARDRKEALYLIKDLLAKSGETPTYIDRLETPPSDLEKGVDATLAALAQWGSLVLSRTLRQEYSGIVKHYQPTLKRVMPGIEVAATKAIFETALAKYPLAFPRGFFLEQVFRTI